MIDYIAITVTCVSVILAIWLLFVNFRLREEACADRRDRVDAEIREQTAHNIATREAEAQFALKFKMMSDQFDSDNVHLLSQALADQSAQSLNSNIKAFIEQKFNRLAQQFVGNITDGAESTIMEMNIDLCEKIWDSFQGYKETSKESPYIFPEGAKIAYTKGKRTVMVIEQKPQARSVTFNRELVTDSVAARAQGETDNGFRFNLSFPYVYFVIAFDNSKYFSHEMYFRNKALTSVREHVYLAPLPNVHRNSDRESRPVCMGGDFKSVVQDELTIARQCEIVVSDFWMRTFSGDLGNGEPNKVDKRIKNYAVWQKNTQDDPMFILSVNWSKGKTIKGVVETMLENRTQDHQLDPVDSDIRVQLENGVLKLTKKLQDEIQQVKKISLLKTEIDQQSGKILEQVVLGHAKRVFAQCSKK